MKYSYNLKELYSILIHFKMLFIPVMAKLNFPVLGVTWSFRNHSNMLICCSTFYLLLLSMLKSVKLLIIFLCIPWYIFRILWWTKFKIIFFCDFNFNLMHLCWINVLILIKKILQTPNFWKVVYMHTANRVNKH